MDVEVIKKKVINEKDIHDTSCCYSIKLRGL